MSWQIQIRMQLGELELDVELSGDATPVALVGPNGSGKTTLLRTIAGAYRPATGAIQLGDRTLFDSGREIDIPPEERRVGYVPQGSGLFPHLTAIDNVAFGLLSHTPPIARDARRQAAAKLLQRMDCAQLAARYPAALSGGEQQRVALARALMTEPQMLLLDEPLSALDARARRAVRTFLAEHLREHRGPALVVTHDLRDIRALDAHVYVIDEGKIAQHGTVAELAEHPATELVTELFASAEPAGPRAPAAEP